MPQLATLIARPTSTWREADVEYVMDHPAFWQGGHEETENVRTRVRAWFDTHHPARDAADTQQQGADGGDLDAFGQALEALSESDPDDALDAAVRRHLTGLFRDPSEEDAGGTAPEVEVLQEALNGGAAPDRPLRLDGVLGPRTRAALRTAVAGGRTGAVMKQLRALTAV